MTHFLHTDADLQAGLAQLIVADPRLKPIAERAGADAALRNDLFVGFGTRERLADVGGRARRWDFRHLGLSGWGERDGMLRTKGPLKQSHTCTTIQLN